jgi:hypothetical protein
VSFSSILSVRSASDWLLSLSSSSSAFAQPSAASKSPRQLEKSRLVYLNLWHILPYSLPFRDFSFPAAHRLPMPLVYHIRGRTVN